MSFTISVVSFVFGFLGLFESVLFGLIISTVDTDQIKSSPLVKRMSVVANSVLILLL